jgi:hypothetical protein
MKVYIWVFFENLSRNFKFHYNLTRKPATLHEDQYKFSVTSRSVILRMINISHKICRENQNTPFVQYPPRKCPLWHVENYCRAAQATDDNMAHACKLQLRNVWHVVWRWKVTRRQSKMLRKRDWWRGRTKWSPSFMLPYWEVRSSNLCLAKLLTWACYFSSKIQMRRFFIWIRL